MTGSRHSPASNVVYLKGESHKPSREDEHTWWGPDPGPAGFDFSLLSHEVDAESDANSRLDSSGTPGAAPNVVGISTAESPDK
jgi:hypothetical protein